jgi:hypothetical protein
MPDICVGLLHKARLAFGSLLTSAVNSETSLITECQSLKAEPMTSEEPYLPVICRELGPVWHGVTKWPQCSVTASIVVGVKQSLVYMYTHNLKVRQHQNI